MNSFKKFIKGFEHAFLGLKYALRYEKNFRVQLIIAIIVFFLMFYFPLRISEKGILVLMIVIVLTLELINTVFERLSDILKPRLHFYVKEIKNIMAATVLIACLGALIIGLIIFLPHLKNLLDI